MKRFKTRYLALKVECEVEFNKDSFFQKLIETYLRLYGEYGLSKANLRLLEFKANFIILSVSHGALPYLRAALTLIRELDSAKMFIHVLGVSGTVKRVKAKFLPVDIGKS